jgi:hypothetical protein
MINQKGFTHIIIALVSFAVAMVIFVGAWWLIFGQSDETNINTSAVIDSFEDCIAAGYPAMESYPRQCSDGDQTFREVIANINTNQ